MTELTTAPGKLHPNIVGALDAALRSVCCMRRSWWFRADLPPLFAIYTRTDEFLGTVQLTEVNTVIADSKWTMKDRETLKKIQWEYKRVLGDL